MKAKRTDDNQQEIVDQLRQLGRGSTIKNCRCCQVEFKVKNSHYFKKFYCSRACMASDYKVRLLGDNNPNRRNLAKTCMSCGSQFESYIKTRKYCSQRCAGKSEQNINKLRAIAGLPRKARIKKAKGYKECVICGDMFAITHSKKVQSCSKKCSNELHSIRNKRELIPNKVCGHCNKSYHSYTKGRKYCSVKCSHESGTPQRAGNANVISMKRYGAKKDANHNIITEYLEKRGCFVRDLSGAGNGVPDLLVWVKNAWILVEIKNIKTGYGKRGLNEKQKQWAANWNGGKVYVVTSIEDAELLATQQFDKLKSFPTDKLEVVKVIGL